MMRVYLDNRPALVHFTCHLPIMIQIQSYFNDLYEYIKNIVTNLFVKLTFLFEIVSSTG